ncbi:MAG: GAK system ATP-grasp enzyme [Proteobacteria bacterium]|nr:GAK system ATP-grasp enzyme [Pseudomonadota bacterium]MBU1594184.1 GAK system ATP-grasp enzyme [Pseudomonadota bacterium]
MHTNTTLIPTEARGSGSAQTRMAVIGVRGGWSSEVLADRVAEAAGGLRLLVELDQLRLDLPSGRAMYMGHDLSTFDGLIIKKLGFAYSADLLDRLEVLRFLAGRGVRIFSPPQAIAGLLNRLACTVTLQLAGIPMPPTTITEDLEQALAAVADYGVAILKPLYSTKARGMLVLRPEPETREALLAFQRENPVFYLQKAINVGEQDLGVVFLGGEYLTTYARTRKSGEWNTTTASGGKYVPFDPPQEVIELARQAQAPFGLDFTCVDVALTDSGPYVFEVSAFGGFRGIQEARGIDAARLYAQYALRRIRK